MQTQTHLFDCIVAVVFFSIIDFPARCWKYVLALVVPVACTYFACRLANSWKIDGMVQCYNYVDMVVLSLPSLNSKADGLHSIMGKTHEHAT